MYHHHHKVLLQKEHNFWLYKLIMIPDVDIFEFIPEMTTIFDKTNQCVIKKVKMKSCILILFLI